MAITALYNTEKEKVGEIELNDAIFAVDVKPCILHDIVRMQMANRRTGNACTKTMAEVNGSSKKPWKQKGTGRARSGHKRSPLWRGGGTVFGPKPRDYSYALPKRVRKLGLKMALATRFAENQMIVLDDLRLAGIKTKNFVAVMNKLALDSALIVIPERNEILEKSSRNAFGYKVLATEGLNVYDILRYRNLVILQPTIGKLEERLLS